jgi:outer membrane protein
MKRLIILLGLAVSLTTHAQDGVKETAPASFTLQQAVDYALQNQTNVKNAVIDEQLAKQKVNEVTGLGLPQINSSFDVKDFLEIPTSLIPAEFFGGPPGSFAAVKFGTKYQATAGLDASQLLFSGDYFLGLKASKVFVELSTKSTQRTRIETTTAVSKMYYTVLINQERMGMMEANMNRLKKTLDDTKALLDNGLVEKIDFDRLTVSYNNLLVEQEKVNRLLNLGMYLLKFQMGMPVSSSLTLTDKLADLKFDVSAQVSADKFDYSKRVEYGLFETQFSLAKLELKRNKFAYLPTAAAYGSLSGGAYREQFDIFDTKKGWYPTALIGAKISMPIFTGLQRNARAQQAKLKLQQSQNNLDQIKNSIDLDLSTSLTTLQNATASYEIQKKNITLAEDVVRVAKIKYDQGVGSNLELVTAESSLKEAQTNYYNALFDALVAKIDFDKANGNIK